MALEAFINGDKQKTGKKRGRTLRFELELTLPTEESTNEFSYADLVDEELRKAEGQPRDVDLLSKGPDNQLAALALRLEEKYGAPSPKKRKKQRIFESDLIDRGRGYDTSDSFVDDSEMYEDFVPPQVDTKFGGFYVNTGDLEFKETQDMEEDMDVVMKKKKPKMKKQSSHHTPQSILANQKLKKAKQHVAAQKVPKPKASKTLFKTSSSVSNSSNSTSGKPSHKKSTAVMKNGETATIGGASSTATTNLQSLKGGNEGDQSNKSNTTSEVPKPPPVLPEDLPEGISAAIKLFEESLGRDQANTPDGKISVKMRCSYDKQLTELELDCRKLPMKKRTAVLEYVSHKLGVSRATTIKRIRQVMKKREEEALAQPLQRLKEAVDASMPEQLQQYEQELKARADSLSAGEKLPVAHLDVEDENTTDEVFDQCVQESSSVMAESTKKRAPRKKYKWNDETRHLLCEVVRVKVESEEMMRGRANGEETLMEFLDARVKPLWPKGWMQKSILYKTTEAVHRHFTNPQSKKVTPSVKKEKEKIGEQKKESQVRVSPSPSSSSSTSPLVTTTKKAEIRNTSLQTMAKLPKSDASSSKPKEEVKKVQWAVRSTGTSNGSPITILTKTLTDTTAASSANKSSLENSGKVQITPRMAQLLSSVASSQALVKSSKADSTLSASLLTNMSSPTQKQRVVLQSDVQALLSHIQSSHQIPSLDGNTQPVSVITSSGATPLPKVTVPILSPSASSSRCNSGGKISSPKSKITTSPIQMKAIVSQLNPKTSSQVQVMTFATNPASMQLQVTPSREKSAVVQPQSSLPVKTGVPSKAKVTSTSESSANKLPKFLQACTALSMMSRPPSKPSPMPTHHFQVPLSTHSVVSKPQTPKLVPAKKVSPSKTKVVSEGGSGQHPIPMKKLDHSNAKHSTSPLSNSSSSSSSHHSHLPLSAIVLPSTPPPSSPPSATNVLPPLVASTTLSGSSLYSSSALEGTPIETILLQPPSTTQTVAATSRQQMYAGLRNTSDSSAAMAVTTLPFSSGASTLVLTSNLPQLSYHVSSSLPTNVPSPRQTLPLTHPLTISPPPRSLTISPHTVPMAGAQVLVAGLSGTSVKSPVEQIYLEHSYGVQTQPSSADGRSMTTGSQTINTVADGTSNQQLPQ